jgi:hypothetical protein
MRYYKANKDSINEHNKEEYRSKKIKRQSVPDGLAGSAPVLPLLPKEQRKLDKKKEKAKSKGKGQKRKIPLPKREGKRQKKC